MTVFNYSGKTAIVTGGCGGLGAAISTAFLNAGANVIALDIQEANVKSFTEKAGEKASSSLLAMQADITDESALDKVFADGVAKFGQIDFLVNNAGIMDSFEPVGELERKVWDRVMAVNLTAPYLTSKRLALHVAEKGHQAAIVIVSSIAGQTGWGAGSAYTASKWGVTGLTKSIAAFYADKNIRCNAIMPGPMETNITAHFKDGCSEAGTALMQKKMQTIGPSADLPNVAAVVLFLCSDEAKFVSGSTVPVDSAWTAK